MALVRCSLARRYLFSQDGVRTPLPMLPAAILVQIPA
jgi:hypothetical protein